MRITKSIINLTTRALSESMDTRSMTHLARDLMGSYNLYERIGLPESLPIAGRIAAAQIMTDIVEQNLFLTLIQKLIDIQYNGYMGKQYTITNLREIIQSISEQGFLFEREHRIFVEDPRVRRTPNWGTLREGEEYLFSFIQLDVAGSSELVRNYPQETVQETYRDLRTIVRNAIDKRNGRTWSINGDGMLIAFHFGDKNLLATLSAMEIVHELFIYNRTGCRLSEPIEVRIAVHSGTCEYSENMEEIKNSETIKRVTEMEGNYTKPGTATISHVVLVTLDTSIAGQFQPIATQGRTEYYSYEIRWEK